MDRSLSRCVAIAQRCGAGALSAPLALMEMLIASEDVALVEQAILQGTPSAACEPAQRSRYDELARVFRDNREGCAKIAAILAAEATQGEAPSLTDRLTFVRQLFDTLVQQNEETSVALYSLGNPQILATATEEIVTLLGRHQLLGPQTRVLDFGCGIGRMAVALAPHVQQIDGVDLSEQMVAAARRRCEGLDNVRISACDGRDLQGFASASRELVLAVDSFPYVVQGGETLVQAIFAEAARVLTRGGHFALLNFSYRDDLARDSREVSELAERHGFRAKVLAEQPFSLWNGALFLLQRT